MLKRGIDDGLLATIVTRYQLYEKGKCFSEGQINNIGKAYITVDEVEKCLGLKNLSKF